MDNINVYFEAFVLYFSQFKFSQLWEIIRGGQTNYFMKADTEIQKVKAL